MQQRGTMSLLFSQVFTLFCVYPVTWYLQRQKAMLGSLTTVHLSSLPSPILTPPPSPCPPGIILFVKVSHFFFSIYTTPGSGDSPFLVWVTAMFSAKISAFQSLSAPIHLATQGVFLRCHPFLSCSHLSPEAHRVFLMATTSGACSLHGFLSLPPCGTPISYNLSSSLLSCTWLLLHIYC